MQGKQIFPVSYLGLVVGFVSGAVWGVAWYLTSRLPVYFNLASVLAGTGYFLGYGVERHILSDRTRGAL